MMTPSFATVLSPRYPLSPTNSISTLSSIPFHSWSRGARQRCDDGASALARRDAMAIGGGFARDEAGASWLFWLVMRLPWQDEGEVTVKAK